MRAEEALHELQKKYHDISFALNESSIVAITNNKGIIQFVNDKFCEQSKYSREELIGTYHNIINSGYHPKAFFKDMWKTIGNGNVWKGEIKNKAKDGSYYWVDTTIVPFLNEKDKPYQYIAIRHDITSRKVYEAKIKKIAYYDPLTGLPNRNIIPQWLARKDVYANKIAVLVIDIDRFKAINDNFNFDTGNLILKSVGLRLQNVLTKNDLLLREGADKFIIILSEVASEDKVLKVIEEVKQQISIPFYMKGERIVVSISIGISVETINVENKCNIDNLERIMQQSDHAMYHAKQQFGNTHYFSTKDQHIEMARYVAIESGLRKALKNEQFQIVYQPIMHLESGKMTSVEALLRWKHPELGFISPAEFVPILEEMGLIIPVGNWILREVIKQMKQWQNDDVMINRIAVNVSPIQFQDKQFFLEVRNILDEAALDPSFLELEITEGTILNIHEPQKTLEQFRQLGVRISIDDFGTGYSSLSYLKQLPITTIKIDQSFISDLDEQDEMIVHSIINLGKNLKFNIIAEGIETQEQLKYLRSQSCIEGQGYYWSKPVCASEIEILYQQLNNK